MESHEPQAIEPPIASSTIPKHTFNGTLFRPCTNRWGGGGGGGGGGGAKIVCSITVFPSAPWGGIAKKHSPHMGKKVSCPQFFSFIYNNTMDISK